MKQHAIAVAKSKFETDQPALGTGRITALTVFIFVFAAVIVLRLFSLQVLQHPYYEALASDSQEVYRNLLPSRGSIYVREDGDLHPLVTNRDYYLVYAEPSKIESPSNVIDSITSILGLTEEEWKALLPKLSKADDPYEPIKQKVSQQQVDQIKALGLAGIGWTPESYRYYPEKNLGGHLFGYVGFTDDHRVGLYGLEGDFNEELLGSSGLLKSVKDAFGALITIGPRQLEPAQDGTDLVLTIDRRIQFYACERLKHFYEYFGAEKGSVVILEPTTGAVLAMCAYPDFDPEKYGEVKDINIFNNPAIFHPYEPGSVFKSITMAAAINEGKITPTTTYEDTGEVKVAGYTLRNFDNQAHGVQTMTAVLQQSLNTGAIFAAESIGRKTFRDYVKRFGFGELTGIELDTEVAGNISPLDKDADVFYMTASYGHGLTTTLLQLAAAYGAVANGGWLMQPYIVAEKIIPGKEPIITESKKIRQPISERTATIITGMLTSVVEDSYDRKAKVEGYYLAAKTGTALIPGASGGYSNQTIHSVMGFGPISNPRFVIAIRLDKPQGVRFASDTITPLFSQIASYLLDYYQIPPDY